MMDVLYPYLSNDSKELEWSIKSLKNVDHNEVYVVGSKVEAIDAKFLNPHSYSWSNTSPYNNVISKILTGIDSGISDEFIFMNDDIFLMDRYKGETYNRRTLLEHIESRKFDSYTQALKNTRNYLLERGYPEISYETHTPMVFDKSKMRDLITSIIPLLSMGHNLMIRSLYGNVYGVKSTKLDEDTKNPIDWVNKPILSTNERSFNGAIGHYIRSVLSGIQPDDIEPQYSVSVVIPAYNAEKTIEACLDSIPDHKAIKEIIVVDDCSKDNTVNIIKNYKRRKINIIPLKENKGVGHAFNTLLNVSNGDFILRLDSDDTLRTEITKVLDNLDGSDIVYFNMVDNDGTVRELNLNTRMKTVANCKLYRREFIGDQRTIEANWSEDRYLHRELLKKNPTELYTGINAYNYNYPREGSLTDIHKKIVSGELNEEITLNLFTNCHIGCINDPTIFDTYESYVDTFGYPDYINIYCDPNPNPSSFVKYREMIKDYFGEYPTETKSLSDGYQRSINSAKTKYIFQLEADWNFQNIKHSMQSIVNQMMLDNLWFMLFNQHKNIDDPRLGQWQSYLKAHNGIYSKTDRISNNPHIIEVESYKKKAYPLVDWTIKGAGQIEQALEKKFDVAIYGQYGLEPTIVHKDMRRGGKK